MSLHRHPELRGDPRPRRRLAVVALAVPLLGSVAFLLKLDAVVSLGWATFLASLPVAVEAGRQRGGALVGCGAVFLGAVWAFLVPPLVGYLRWSMAARYAPPRMLAYKLGPRGELIEGLTNGPPFAAAVAVVVGGSLYLAGYGLRRLTA